MKKIILLTLCMAVSLFVVAQKETYNWVFGYNSGLTWNTTRSVSLTGLLSTASDVTLDDLPASLATSISTLEGCFSLSDSDGNLLFYSDGMTVYNKNNVAMTNGTSMTGNSSSAQSGIIIPYPGSTNKYIAVTVGMTRANNLSYSVIDMSAQGGLGEVVLAEKNIRFQNAMGLTSESVTSIRHSNGTDYWILAIGQQTTAPSYINAWLLTSSGMSTTPVVTTLPYAMSGNGSSGYLKISPDGKHFVWPSFVDNRFFYGDFDSSTAEFSNIKVITGLNNPYGVEFSSEQSIVYITEKSGLTAFKADELFTSPTSATVTQKKYAITNTDVTALQIGPDKRIYWVAANQNYMRIIDNADDYDNIALYQTPASFIAKSGVGLPSFAASWFSAKAKLTSFLCLDNNFKFSVSINMTGLAIDLPVSLLWDFGDGSTAVSQPIVSGTIVYEQSHTYSTTGQYTVSITPYKSDGTAMSKTTLPANVVECVFKTNRMIRQDMLNSATKTANR